MGTPLIVVCMAERAPSSAELARLLECDIAGVMLDTADKSGARLTEILSMPALRDFVRQVRGAGVLCGLAGRLNVGDIERLVGLGADYLGFRGALCRDGDRNAAIDAAEVAMVASRLMHTREARKFNHSVR